MFGVFCAWNFLIFPENRHNQGAYSSAILQTVFWLRKKKCEKNESFVCSIVTIVGVAKPVNCFQINLFR